MRLHDRFGDGTLDPQVHYTSTSSAFGEHGRIVECRSCGMVYMNPRPHHQKVQDRYSEVRDERYLEEEQGRVETFTESLDLVAGFAPGRRLLDVGCHVGTFLEIAEQRGFEVAGVEPSRWAADVARERITGTVHCGAVEDAPLPEGGYDVVTMWDVVEHLPDPALDLRAVYHALRPGGIFVALDDGRRLAVPPGAGPRWPWYMQMHLVYFSRRTLAEMLRREGFHIVDVRAHVRRVRLSYLASRLDAYVPPPRAPLGRRLDRTGLATTVGREPRRHLHHHGAAPGANALVARRSRLAPTSDGPAAALEPAAPPRSALGSPAGATRWPSRWLARRVARRRRRRRLVRAPARRAADRRAARAARRLGRVVVREDRRVRLRPDARARQRAGVLPALPLARRRGACRGAVRQRTVLGIVLSNVLFVAAVLVLWRLTADRFGEAIANA